VMDDGHMTDGKGRNVDFRNTIIIMTSNIGSDWILSESDPDRMREKVMEAVSMTFKPEFINRIDDIVVFHRLSREHIAEIVKLQVQGLANRLEARNLHLELTDAALDYLAEKGYDPSFGARPMKRLIARELADRLALEMLQGSYSDGDTIVIDAQGGLLIFDGRPAGAEALESFKAE
jgi:ATP-dependent Clp protease ATP-binding subunit ClpB